MRQAEVSKFQGEKTGCSDLICIQQGSLFEGQDDRACQHKSASKPMMPRQRFAKNNGCKENCKKDA
jgi:hypothetical protein